MNPTDEFDVVVLGAGPAGQKAAVQSAKAGRRVALIDEELSVGGACVRRGTIPSKTLRDSVSAWMNLRRVDRSLARELPRGISLDALMQRKDDIVSRHSHYMEQQLARNRVVVIRGRARFTSPHVIDVALPRALRRSVIAAQIIIATGSRPRSPQGLGVDHETVFDSDSILSLAELPRSLVVLGGGVIACEYASIFAGLGVEVTILDRGTRPVSFLDEELSAGFLAAFREMGGKYIGGVSPSQVVRNADLSVTVGEGTGPLARAERVLCCLGRVANVEHLHLAKAGLAVNERGLLDVDAGGRTSVANIWAAGDVIGAPALASTSMEQGRRAALGALGVHDEGAGATLVPTGVYTIPELGAVGLTEGEARAQHEDVRVGRARFDEIARGLISGQAHGMLKLVCDRAGERVLGVHAIGDGACDLVHVGLMAMIGRLPVRTFVEQPMNFPTLAEAYRVAALAVLAPAGARTLESARVPSPIAGTAPAAAS